MTETEPQTTSELLERLLAEHDGQETASIGGISHSLRERGFGVLLAVAALPPAIPLPVPGYTTIFAVPLFLLSLQMMLGQEAPWLPAWLKRRRVKRTAIAALVKRGNPVLRRVERLLKPRLIATDIRLWEKLVGVFALLFSLSIALPVPLTHTLPAFGILGMALGLISRDGVMVILGIATGCVGLLVTAAVLYLTLTMGTAAAQHFLDKVGP